MNCAQVKKLIPVYLDGELEGEEIRQVKDHLAGCPNCREELQAFEKSWAMLEEWKDIEPPPGYVSRFWTAVSQRKTWQERMSRYIQEGLVKIRLTPVAAAVCVVVLAGLFALRNYWQIQELNQFLGSSNEADWEMVENIELAENLDIIEDMDLLEDLEIIENLEMLET